MAALKSLVWLMLLLAIERASCQNDTCYEEAVASDDALARCNKEFMDVLSNEVEKVVDFCPSCSRCVAQNYHRCRDSGGGTETARFGEVGTKTLGDIIQTACATDPDRENKYCGDLIDWNLNPQYNMSLIYANQNCSGKSDCNNPNCKAAIEALGCCAVFAHLFGGLRSVSDATFEDCNVTACSAPYDLSPLQPCGASSIAGLPVMALSIMVLFTAVIF